MGGDVQLVHHSVQNNLQNLKVYQLIIRCVLLTSVGTELHHLLLHVLLHVGVADHGAAGNILIYKGECVSVTPKLVSRFVC